MADRNQTVDALRPIAALWVCLFHFTSATGVGTHGYLGVTMFFVISGFIVPHSMMRGGYTIAAWLGAISYSLYLLHVPVGYRVSTTIRRLSDAELAPILAIVGALAVSIAAAALLHRYVEQPALRLAARIGYRGRRLNVPQWAVSRRQ